VLDFDRQVLTWYVTDEDGSFGTGASCTADHHPHLRPASEWSAAMHAVARAWTGWTVVWAFDAVADLLRAAAVIGPGDALPEALASRLTDLEVYGPEPEGWSVGDVVDFLITVDDGTGVWRHACGGASDRGAVLAHGPAVLDSNALLDPAQVTQIPTAGLHADPARRRAYLWSTVAMPAHREIWRRHWPGWDLTFGGARWEVHGDLVGGLGPFGTK